MLCCDPVSERLPSGLRRNQQDGQAKKGFSEDTGEYIVVLLGKTRKKISRGPRVKPCVAPFLKWGT